MTVKVKFWAEEIVIHAEKLDRMRILSATQHDCMYIHC